MYREEQMSSELFGTFHRLACERAASPCNFFIGQHSWWPVINLQYFCIYTNIQFFVYFIAFETLNPFLLIFVGYLEPFQKFKNKCLNFIDLQYLQCTNFMNIVEFFRLEQLYNVIIQDRLDLLFLALKAESKKLGKNNYSVAPFCHFIGELKSRPWEF